MIRGEGLEGERMRRRSEYNQLIAHRDVRRDPGERRKPYFDKDAKKLIVGGSYTDKSKGRNNVLFGDPMINTTGHSDVEED